jgi:site-specific DNA-cytosine methylase
MKVLIACEYSGTVREAFRARGHDAWSCDLLDTDQPGPHIQGDVRDVLKQGWDLMIAHPPCTHLAVSGARYFKEKKEQQAEALSFVRELMAAPVPRICIENPVSIISSRIRRPDQIIQPWMFGEDASKKTCLWLTGLPKLQPTNVIIKERYANQTASGQNKIGPSPDRWKIRSKTYQGIANAMACQWGNVKDLTSWISQNHAIIFESRHIEIPTGKDLSLPGGFMGSTSCHDNMLNIEYINKLPSICGLRG